MSAFGVIKNKQFVKECHTTRYIGVAKIILNCIPQEEYEKTKAVRI